MNLQQLFSSQLWGTLSGVASIVFGIPGFVLAMRTLRQRQSGGTASLPPQSSQPSSNLAAFQAPAQPGPFGAPAAPSTSQPNSLPPILRQATPYPHPSQTSAASNPPTLPPGYAAPNTQPLYGQYAMPYAAPPAVASRPLAAPIPVPAKRGWGVHGVWAAILGGLSIAFFALCAISLVTAALFSHTPASGTPTATLGVTLPPRTIALQDSLTTKSNTHDWAATSYCFFASDGYHVKSEYNCYSAERNFGDATITVTSRQISGDTGMPYGIAFRASKGSYYWFAVDRKGDWAFFKSVSGTSTTLQDYTFSSAIRTSLSDTNTLIVNATGSHFVFYINGTYIAAKDDTSLTAGYAGVGVGSGEAVFSNFSVAI